MQAALEAHLKQQILTLARQMIECRSCSRVYAYVCKSYKSSLNEVI